MTVFVAFSLCLCCSTFESEAATYYAEDIVNYANSQVGTSQTAGMCMGWVNGAFNSVYGWERQGCCAYKYGSQMRVDTRKDNIPLGAIVYFQYVDSYAYGKVTDYCGNYAGHIGIYVGNGMIVHSFDWANGNGTRVYKDSISKLDNPSLYNYCGWGWYNKTSLDQGSKSAASTAKKTATVKLETLDGDLAQGSAYGSWGDVKTTTTKPTESDTLKITGTSKKTQYKYYHYHNAYDGSQMMIDSISYTGNWGYCEMYKDSALSNTMSFQDKGGKTSVKKGDGCQYGYTLWFEDVVEKTVYSYQERTKNASVSDTIKIGEDRVISFLPTATKDGATFKCWNTKLDGSGVSYNPGENVVFGEFTADACYVLYAIFEATSTATTVDVPAVTEQPAEIVTPVTEPTMVSGGKHGTIKMVIGLPVIWIDEVSQMIDEQGTSPVIENSRTLLPVRAVVEAMGGTVEWNDSSRIVSMEKDATVLYMRIGSNMVWDSRGNTDTLDCAPKIINGRTMLPIRYIAEYFDGSVGWDDSTKTVSINY